MNSLFLMSLAKYKNLVSVVVTYRKKILFSSSLALLLLSLVAKVLNNMKSKGRYKTLSKNQKKTLLKSKLFFRGIFQKVKIELNGNEGIKYSKTQMFLDKIVKNYQMKQRFVQKKEEKETKKDKVFYCILNNYLNQKA